MTTEIEFHTESELFAKIAQNEKLPKHIIPFIQPTVVFNFEDLNNLIDKHNEIMGNKTKIRYTSFISLAGVDVQLYYQQGKFTSAITIGDKLTGIDFTDKISNIPNVTLRLTKDADIIINGTVTIREADYFNVNDLIINNENSPYHQFTNVEDLIINALYSGDTKLLNQDIRFYANELLYVDKCTQHPVNEQFKILQELGFSIPENTNNNLANTAKDIYDRINDIQKNKYSIPYQLKGIIVKPNDPKILENTKKNEHSNDPCIYLWKLNNKGTETQVKKIDWSMEPTGELIPHLKISKTILYGEPVTQIDLSSARSLSVYEEPITVNSRIIINTNDDNIPRITNVLPLKKKKDTLINCCPYCQSKLYKNERGGLFCTNPNCEEQLYARIIRYVAGVEPSLLPTAIRLIELKIIKSDVDIFTPHQSTIDSPCQSDLDKFTNTMLNISLVNLLYSLSIPYLTKAHATQIAYNFSSITLVIELFNNEPKLRHLHLGTWVTNSILHWYSLPEHKALLNTFQNDVHLVNC